MGPPMKRLLVWLVCLLPGTTNPDTVRCRMRRYIRPQWALVRAAWRREPAPPTVEHVCLARRCRDHPKNPTMPGQR